MHSKIVGYLLTGILFTGCVTAEETGDAQRTIKADSKPQFNTNESKDSTQQIIERKVNNSQLKIGK
ncbi:MAG: hypothetical protein CL843_15365 [Crocinitomicaceae bacterium]|nr:hypothetical protein [Crocinitomicaceae bacterium]